MDGALGPAARTSELRAHTEAVRALKTRIGRDLWELGTRLNDVRERQLWSGEYQSFEDYLKRGADVGRSSAYQSMRVAAEFTEGVAERYGSEKLDAAVTWLRATPAEERPGDVFTSQIRVRDARGAFTQVSLHEATASHIREATELLGDAKKGGQRIPADWNVRAEALGRVMPGTGAGRVRLGRDRSGRLTANFHQIPVDDLEQFLTAVRAHLLEG